MARDQVLYTKTLDPTLYDLSNSLAMLGEKQGKLAMARALNHEGKKAMTAVVRHLAKSTSVKQSTIRKGLRLRQAWTEEGRDDYLNVQIIARGKHLSLSEFKPRQLKKGVSATVWGKRQRFDGAFMLKKAGSTVFKNTGEWNPRSGRNNNIEKLWGPSLPVELQDEETRKVFEDHFDNLHYRVTHEVNRLMPPDMGFE
ncbi:phage tail protein [Marivivens aquimaris]|uniref:phage tail protein n=1 Tax=Marivivens aquimaris TaxID=2774876 RepID=UPI001881715E|nr:phage tail protein [Marivivens aquimaris]